ncbi:MAG TPA: substrate-binding domain-containing protein, partial [Gaiellaceae bacterium]|nr:substrate-binding domain-containing protein [Gaiellaceae bacterium]
AAALGDTLTTTIGYDASSIDSLIAQHVAAIIADNERNDYSIDQALGRARKAGIPTLSIEDPYSNSVWVSQSSLGQYAHALADDLASQMGSRGQYMLVSCYQGDANVQAWLRVLKHYMPRRYPRMHRVGVAYGDTGDGNVDKHLFTRLLRAHRHLRGLIFLCPGDASFVPPHIVRAHEVGKVFSVGNGGDCPPLYIDWARSVEAGAEEAVCAGDPAKLGYLAVWAADHLARSHTLTFAPGSYDVGGPVGTVVYYSKNQELRLGQPLTITQANLAEFGEPDFVLSPGTYKGNAGEPPAKQYSYDLGPVAQATQTFTVTNDAFGTSDQLGVTGGDANFVVENDTCAGTTLAPGGTCTFAVAYTAPPGCTSGGLVGPAAVAIFGGDPTAYGDIHLAVVAQCP